VFRGIAAFIVFIVALGPSATLLCKGWCDPEVAAATDCHDDRMPATPTMAGNDDCGGAALAPAAWAREGIGRGVAASDFAAAVVAQHRVIPTVEATSPFRYLSGADVSLDPRALTTVLRI
jgi:hypothetical protein